MQVEGKPYFDEYAESYDQALNQAISMSGEDKSYFARGRVKWLDGCLRGLSVEPASLMDYGCGIGSSLPHLFDLPSVRFVLGVDVSPKSLEVARREHAQRAHFKLIDEHRPGADIDLAYCANVFHHIPPDERAAAVDYVYRSLKPGGLFSFWENNPWNPATRYVVSRCPFDRDAILLNPYEARRLLRGCGFEVVRTDFMFIFPKVLRWLRGIEPLLSRLPLGTQYQVLCRKP